MARDRNSDWAEDEPRTKRGGHIGFKFLITVSIALIVMLILGLTALRYGPCEWRGDCLLDAIEELEESFPEDRSGRIGETQTGEGCEEKSNDILFLTETLACREVLYVTSRQFDPKIETFGSSPSPTLSYGFSSAVIPRVPPYESRVEERVSTRAEKLVNLRRSDPEHPVFAQLADAGIAPETFDGDNVTSTIISRERDPAFTASLRGLDCPDDVRVEDLSDSCQLAAHIGISKLQIFGNDPNITQDNLRAIFFEEVSKRLGDSRTIMIYLHGFDETFSEGIASTAYLEDSLKLFTDEYASAENTSVLPINYSWPTYLRNELAISAASRGILPQRVEQALTNYIPSQVRASEEAKRFSEFVEELNAQVQPDRILIVAHSMGNRVLVDALPDISLTLSVLPNPPDIKIVHFAGDYGQKNYKEIVDKILEQKKDRAGISVSSANYFSETDDAMLISSASQLAKANWWNYRNRLEGDTGGLLVAARRRLLLAISAADASLYQAAKEVDPIMRPIMEDFRKAGFTEEEMKAFFTEAACRIGMKRNVSVAGCRPIIETRLSMNSIDSSEYGFDDFLHGYFQLSPMIGADFACEIESLAPGGAERSLVADETGFFTKKTYWRPDLDDDAAIDACRAYTERVRVGLTINGIKVPLVSPPKSDYLVEELSITESRYWKFGSTTAIVEKSSYDDAASKILSVDLLIDAAVCQYDAVLGVGVASFEGSRDRNETLAERRTNRLRKVLSQAVGGCPGSVPPAVYTLNAGQACSRVDGCSPVFPLLIDEDPNSLTERKLFVLGIKEFSDINEPSEKVLARYFDAYVADKDFYYSLQVPN